MNVGLIAVRYSKALYDFSMETGEADEVLLELNHFFKQTIELKALAGTLSSPVVDQASKLRLLRLASGGQTCTALERFFKLIMAHKREDILPDISLKFRQLYEEKMGILNVKLITAVPIDANRQAAFQKQLEESTGKKIVLTLGVQPEIIGGFILKTDEKRLDASIKNRLQTVKKQLTV
jgi:F-type H+-transporting ATPase subunit delta